MTKELVKIKDFSMLTTPEMYREFNNVREYVTEKETAYESLAVKAGLSVRFNSKHTIIAEFNKRHGFYLDCTRLFDSDRQRTLIWYKVKDCIANYYELSSATITDNHIRVCSELYAYENHTLQKKFKSGSCLYEPTNEIMFDIHLVNTITENFKGV